MKEKCIPQFLQLALAVSCLLAASREVRANSYASSLTNNAGEVSFRLNDAADSVKIVGNGGAKTIDLGPLPRGLTVTNLAGQGLTAGAFQVVVAKNESGAPALIGASVPFNSPRGITVNQNPSSPYFGWVYVANSAAGSKGDGMFAFTSDLFDILGQGATPRTAGLNFATGTTSSPYRPKVGWDDSKVYVTDWSDGTGNLYKMLPDLTADPDGTYVLKPLEGTAVTPVVRDGVQNNTHGSIAAVEVLGTLAAGNYRVYTIDEDYQSDPTSSGLTELNSLWRYDIGSGPLPWPNPPDAKLQEAPIDFVTQTMDLGYSPTTGYFYMSDRRSAGNEPGVFVVDADGNRLFNSRAASLDLGATSDYLADLQGLTVSYDGKYLATIANNNVVTIVPMVNGIPNLAARQQYTAFPTTASARGIAFDRANNLYVVTSGLGILQSLSLGFSATNTTSSDGTFTQIAPAISAQQVSAELLTPISEADAGAFATLRLFRPADSVDSPLTVSLAFAGTATRGTDTTGDYFVRTNGVIVPTSTAFTIPAGSDNLLIDVVANNDNIAELTETLDISIAPGPYLPIAPRGGVVTIADDEPPMIDISAVVFNQMYEGNPFDIVRYRLERRGDTNATFDVNLTYSGTATAGQDYTAVTTVNVESGVLTKTFDVPVLPDVAIEPWETIVVAVAPGAGYTVGTNNVLTTGATAIIRDDDLPAESVLFSDNFNTDTSANWTLRFGSVNPESQDYTATFAFDYSQLLVPSAPHSNGDTLGLLMSANKLDGLLEAAGINAYPNGKDFTGNYALRFDMYLMQNASAGTTEHAAFGINHDTTHTNWFNNSGAGVPAGWTFDGVWAAVIADASALGDYLLFSAPQAGGVPGPTTLIERGASTLEQVFHQPPWTPGGVAGSPGNTPSTATPSWAQVELSQSNGVVRLTINNTNIIAYTNATSFTHGDVMLGYVDSFNSIGSGGGGLVIYDNMRVVQLDTEVPPEVRITSISRNANTVTVDFTAPAGQVLNSVKLYTSPDVVGPFVEDPAATITSNGTNYRATTTSNDAMRFYIIRARD